MSTMQNRIKDVTPNPHPEQAGPSRSIRRKQCTDKTSEAQALRNRIYRLRKVEAQLCEEVSQLRAAAHIYRELVTAARARNMLLGMTVD